MTLAAADPGYRIVDPHVHVWKHDAAFPFAAGAKVPDWDATPEMLLALMKANGITKTVIIQVIHYKYDNSYLAAVLKQYPQYFRGVCRVDPLDPAAPDHLSQISGQPGFHGVRLSPAADASGDWISGPLMPPLWKRCQSLRAPMTLLAPITRVPDIQKLVERFPELTVVIDHMADCPVNQPLELEKLVALVRYPKVFVKISHTWSLSKQKYPWLDAQRLVKRLYDTFGPKRLMWATDWPIAKERATYAQRLTVVKDDMAFLNADDKSWILSKTVERVWPFS
ncbi:MAG TPA: amidohydrolase family protein [Bryobacteraceae bacterium]|jgi:predicted TIM-barrel fold metal-dependent hydrolase|nr:amidohydrolase family protein [Bryobacteraceae bacterium]